MTPDQMRELLDFLRRLHDNNDRAWFDSHRAEWQHVKGIVAGFAAALIDGIAAFDPSVRGLRVPDCTYRIARDTRFSPDKSPYKEWQGIYVAPRGKQSGYAGYYFHVAPCGDRMVGGHILCAGLYCPEPTVLRSVREEIIDNGAEFLASVRAARGFRLDESRKLKRPPTGFPADSEFIELLKLKEFDLVKPIDEAFLLAPDLLERTLEEFRRLQPFVAILNRAVQYAYEEMM